MATIVVLEHALQRRLPYMMRLFEERWRADGHRVLVHHGCEKAPVGDIAVLHVDLTVVPDAYRALLARYPVVVNAAVFDTSKSRVSRELLGPDSTWPGPVIVKTEANFGGKPEQLLRSAAPDASARSAIPLGPVLDQYPIFRSTADVPPDGWSTPGLVVERFLPERQGDYYCVRVWTFFGDRDRSMRWLAHDPIVKVSNLVVREPATVPEEMRARREELGFDFGKFDFVRHADRWVLLDANRTPSAPSGPAVDSQVRAAIAALADGLYAFLR